MLDKSHFHSFLFAFLWMVYVYMRIITWYTLVVHLEVGTFLLTGWNLTTESTAGQVDAAGLPPHTGVVFVFSVDTVPGGVGATIHRIVTKKDFVDSQHRPRSTLDVDFARSGEAGTS
jgi:hypothetical protein